MDSLHQYLEDKCLQVISVYTDNSFASDIAKQEIEWLDNYQSAK